jgi:glycosyltransferase involved in cell wall biosynthesis
MRIGLNMLHLVPRETGGSEIYARRLVPALLASRSDLRLTLFAGREASRSMREEDWVREVDLVELPLNARSRVRRVLAEQTLLPRAAHRARVDLLHNLFTTAPAGPRVPQVTTIHDVIFRRYPETHFGIRSIGLSALVPVAIKRSRRLIAPSEATKEDLVRYFGADAERIDVTYEGPGLPVAIDRISENELRRRLRLGRLAFVLTVSAKRPHKNLERLIEAMARLKISPRPTLVVPGYPTPFEETLRQRAVEAGADVRFAGWIADETLDAAYRAASCLVFPSLAEGFGLPVLEAMTRGTPVACSNASSLPEVAGDAALYFDPQDAGAIAHSIERLVQDPALRDRLTRAGLEQVRKFTWEATAAATLESYERTLQAAASVAAR